MNRSEYERHVAACLDVVARFQSRWPEMAPDDTIGLAPGVLEDALARFGERLDDTYPYFHPVYAGQMLKPPHPVAVLAYFTAMHLNPNNHALDGGPATARMEIEATAALARMVGFEEHLGHLTGGGTVANLEALFVARELAPGRAVAASDDAHYTHARMCHVLGVPFVSVPTDSAGCMDMESLEGVLASGEVGTVVATLGTTGTGALDPVHEILERASHHGVRVHVDAAYGGFFTLIAGEGGIPREPFDALARADSVVIDPHKHGLQPYGCGAVLFRDPAVGRFYVHDSRYTYFTSDDLHLGEISLECSRPGAAAAALWLTTECLPLARDRGLGPILRRCREAALSFASSIDEHERLALVEQPSLDIVTFVPTGEGRSVRAINAAAERVFTATMNDPSPLYLAKMRLPAARLAGAIPDLVVDSDTVIALRSCLMKPEHAAWVDEILARLARHVV